MQAILYSLFLLALLLSACRDEGSSNLFEPQITDGAQLLVETKLKDEHQLLPYRPLPYFDENQGLNIPVPSQQIAQDWVKELQLYQGASLKPMIMVPFSEPIDVLSLLNKQQDDILVNDLIYLIDATEGSDGYLQTVALDFGYHYQASPPFTEAQMPFLSEYLAPSQIALLSQDELKNQTQLLQNNSFLPIFQAQEKENVYWLSFKPQTPLLPNHRYLVVITGGIQDQKQRYISSPSNTHPLEQRDEISKLTGVFKLYGITSVAYSWIFQTANPLDLSSALQALVYGKGEYQSVIQPIKPMLSDIQTWTANPQCLGLLSNQDDGKCLKDDALLPNPALLPIVKALAQTEGLSEEQSDRIATQFKNTEGLWIGEFSGWRYLSHLKQNRYQSRQAAAKGNQLSAQLGEDFEGSRWHFYCFLPKEGSGYDPFGSEMTKKAPFPTAFWQIDTKEHWTALFKVAPYFNQVGYALCGLEGMVENPLLDRQSFDLSFLREWEKAQAQGLSTALLRGNIEASFALFAQKKKLLPQDPLPWERDLSGRELNHALAQLQLIEVLKQSKMGVKLRLDQKLSFGGTGVGANVALISATLNPTSATLVTVDLSTDWLGLALSSAEPTDQLTPLQLLTGSWLKLNQNPNGTYRLSLLLPDYERESVKAILIEDQLSISENTTIYVKVGEQNRLVQKLNLTPTQLLHFPAKAGESFTVSLLTGNQLKKISFFQQAFEWKGENYPSQAKLSVFFDGIGAALGSERLKEAVWINELRAQEDQPSLYLPYLAQRQYIQGQVIKELSDQLTEAQRIEAQKPISSLHLHHLGNSKSTTANAFKLWDAQGLLSVNEPVIFGLSPKSFLVQSQAVNVTPSLNTVIQQSLDPENTSLEPTLDIDNVDEYQDDFPSLESTFQLRLTKQDQDQLFALRFPLRAYEAGRMHGLRYPDLINTTYSYDLYSIQQIALFSLAQGKSNQLKKLDEPCLFFDMSALEACPFNQNRK